MKTIQFDELSSLLTIIIHKNSFNNNLFYRLNSIDTINAPKLSDKLKSFHLLNCLLLKSLYIGDGSFGDLGGKFELKNLPTLKEITIGDIHAQWGEPFTNFSFCSFVIRGIDMI